MHCSVFSLCSANARSDASFQGFGITSAKIRIVQGNRPKGLSDINNLSPPKDCQPSGLSEVCECVWDQLRHHGRVFQITSFGELNLLEVGFSHQEFLMN